MKKVLFFFAVMTASIMVAQDLPSNPQPGKCYVRCTTPDVYVNETVSVVVKPAYKTLKTVPATFKKCFSKSRRKKIICSSRKMGNRNSYLCI